MSFILLSLIFLALTFTVPEPRLSPDGQFYTTFLRNQSPYVLRMGLRPLWRFKNPVEFMLPISYMCILFTAMLLEHMQFGAGILFLGLACTRTNIILPVLTDQIGMFFLTLGFVTHNPIPLILGGLFNEKVPLIGMFINPLAIIGFVFPLFAKFKWQEPLVPNAPNWLKFPLKEGVAKLRKTPIHDLILPWGVAAIGLTLIPWYFILIAYLPLLVAQDRARVYQWIAPLVCVAAAGMLDHNLSSLLFGTIVLVHFMNPWREVL